MICSRIELASVLGVDVRSIDRRVDAGMPYMERPSVGEGTKQWRFDTVSVISWVITQETGGDAPDETKETELRIKKADAGTKEYNLALLQKTVIRVPDVMPRIAAGDAIVKSRMLALPGRAAERVAIESDPAVCLKILKEEVNDALAELSKHWTERG